MSRRVVATDFGGPEVLSVVEHIVPDPGRGEVRIRVRAAGVNPVDHKRYGGMFGINRDELPMPLGSEVAGEVVDVGPDATGPTGPVAVGDDVVAYRVAGGYADDLVAPASSVLPKPASLSWEQSAGLLLTGVTATHVLAVTAVGSGDTLLVHGGAGGVGVAAVQLANARGVRVIATASEPNHAMIRELGAEPVTYGPGLVDRVRGLAPDGVDATADLIGSDEAADTSIELVTDRNRIVTIAGFERAQRDGFRAVGGGPGADPGTSLREAARADLVDLAAHGKFTVVVGRSFPLDEVAAAHKLSRSGHAQGKLVLVP